jgi:hypothetical protein
MTGHGGHPVPGPDGDVLAIDFGTTGTAAAVRRAGRVDPVSFEGRNWLPSCVFRRPDGVLIAGTEADRAAVLDPLSFEPTPKRRVGAGPVRLGGHDYRDADLVTAVFAAVLDEVHHQYPGINRARLVLTHPAVWGTQRCTVLAEAAARVGLPQPQFVAEPVAAAAYYAAKDRPSNKPVCVYDLGGGTFDAAVVGSYDGHLELAGPPAGKDPLGGVDFDRLLLHHVGVSVYNRDPDGWNRLAQPADHHARKDRRTLEREVQAAKESLSKNSAGQVFISSVDFGVQITRDELNTLIAAKIDETIDILLATIAAAHLRPADLGGVYLVGGSSRINLIHDRVWTRLGLKPFVEGNPKLVVVLGAIDALHQLPANNPPEPDQQLQAEEQERQRRHAQEQYQQQQYQQQQQQEQQQQRHQEQQAWQAQQWAAQERHRLEQEAALARQAEEARQGQLARQADAARRAEQARVSKKKSPDVSWDRQGQLVCQGGAAAGAALLFLLADKPSTSTKYTFNADLTSSARQVTTGDSWGTVIFQCLLGAVGGAAVAAGLFFLFLLIYRNARS